MMDDGESFLVEVAARSWQLYDDNIPVRTSRSVLDNLGCVRAFLFITFYLIVKCFYMVRVIRTMAT